ncbi:methyltransferase domain-containing protein [Clostridiaceae bacterium M8S5]|nr:methyltransferase domain-containing protein [Clostridiaceae bacterium M8S5]
MKVKQHYKQYDENSRLTKDNAHRVEFDTSIYYLNKYIKTNYSILDVGAGTGAYSFFYANKGNKVTAIDLSPDNVNIMKNKLTNYDNINLTINTGDATDLKDYIDKSYDIVLCMGPIYHIKSLELKIKCITQCLKVLKNGGILAIAFINKHAGIVNEFARNKNTINDDNIFETFNNHNEECCFTFTQADDIRNIMNTFDVTEIKCVATDGIGYMMKNVINSYTEDEYQKWLRFHISTCEKTDLIGYSLHGLMIYRKNNE